MNQKIKLRTTENDSDKRIDSFLAENIPEHSRSYIQKLIKQGNVEYEGNLCLSPKTKILSETDITINIPDSPKPDLPQPKNIPLDIIYEDDEILVINKDQGVVVHPGDGGEEDSIVNSLLWKFENFADSFEDKKRPGIVHRLDKDTTGCLIISKNQQVLEKLIESFKNRKVEKIYLALVAGHMKTKKNTISAGIGRHPVNRKKMAVLKDGGKNAVTHYEVIKEGFIENTPVSLLQVKIETGRTHQIRVHLASIHKFVLGDTTYGGKQGFETPRQMLHAHLLSIPHPGTSEIMEFQAPVPKDMQKLIDSIR